MEVLCIIPARGGSRRLPRKNVLPLAGKPLLAHSVEHSLNSQVVTHTVVSTEDQAIATVAEKYGAEVISRPDVLASDTATSESALIHALDTVEEDGYSPDLVVFLQCTSPVRDPDDIDRAVQTLLEVQADSLFSATPSHWLIWRQSGECLCSLNYDYMARTRDQDSPIELRENGSIYVFKPWVLRERNNRLGGKIASYQMGYWSSFQIDSLEDLQLCEWIIGQRSADLKAARLPSNPELVIFDFDGVFTDNRVQVAQDGTESVTCSRADSLGISWLKRDDVPTLVLSTETNPVVSVRCAKLGVECMHGITDKLQVLKKLTSERGIDTSQVIYLGNDDNDVECLRLVGCAVVVSDASARAKAAADLVLTTRGGHGAVRELCEMILQGRADRS